MSTTGPKEYIVVTEDAKTLPTNELLTGRGFICGKSGSGKSNTFSVIAEELLEANFNMLIVDTDGEYFGLKEQYELLHAGASSECDVQVEPGHGEKLATIALEENLPVILDVSEIMDGDRERDLIHNVVASLFEKEKTLRKPFLLCLEEAQEYLPQQGGKDDLAELLIRVGKRGRKRGLGICAISQRPSSVDKDFVTQCDWMVWHRMTWQNDVDLVGDILGTTYKEQIDTLTDGEAFLMTDWDESLERVTFRRKKTFDAGGTPGLEKYERPDLKSVRSDILADMFGESGDLTAGISAELAEMGDAPATVDDGNEGEAVEAAALDPLFEADEVAIDDVETADPDDLQAELERLRKRNRVLEDEVAELKAIIRNMESDARSAQPATREAPERNESREHTAPKVLYEEPEEEGVANYLVEFGLLMTFLFYRVSNWVRRAVDTGTNPSPTSSPMSTPADPAYPIEQERTDPLDYVIVGSLVFFATILLVGLIWLLAKYVV